MLVRLYMPQVPPSTTDLNMIVESVSDVLLRYPAFDVLRLQFLDHLDSIRRDRVQGAHHTSILNWPRWANEHQQIWEVGNGESDVALRDLLPLFLLRTSA